MTGNGVTFEKIKEEIFFWLHKHVPTLTLDFLDSEQDILIAKGNRVEIISLDYPDGTKYVAVDFSHPDRNNIPDRSWHTEIGVAALPNGVLQFGTRLVTHTKGLNHPPPPDSTPGIIKRMGKTFKFNTHYGMPIDGQAQTIIGVNPENALKVEALVALLENPKRTAPVIVVTAPTNRNDIELATVNPHALARETHGIAHVFYLDNPATFELSSLLGQELSAFDGAGRIYNPGFNRMNAVLADHPLSLPYAIERRGGPKSYFNHLVAHAYQTSTRNTSGNHEVLPPFTEIRSLHLRLKRQRADQARTAAEQRSILAEQQAAIAVQEPVSISVAPADTVPVDAQVAAEIKRALALDDTQAAPTTPQPMEAHFQPPVYTAGRANTLASQSITVIESKRVEVRDIQASDEEQARLRAEFARAQERAREDVHELQAAHRSELGAMQTQIEEALGLAASEDALKRAAEAKVTILETALEDAKDSLSARKAPALSKGLFPPLNLVGEWADATLGDSVIITNRARKAASALPNHPDLPTIYKGLHLLGRYADMRRQQGTANGKAMTA